MIFKSGIKEKLCCVKNEKPVQQKFWQIWVNTRVGMF